MSPGGRLVYRAVPRTTQHRAQGRRATVAASAHRLFAVRALDGTKTAASVFADRPRGDCSKSRFYPAAENTIAHPNTNSKVGRCPVINRGLNECLNFFALPTQQHGSRATRHTIITPQIHSHFLFQMKETWCGFKFWLWQRPQAASLDTALDRVSREFKPAPMPAKPWLAARLGPWPAAG